MPADDPPPTRERSALMSRVRRKNTAPELAVRRWLHRRGFRFRLHRNDLPGTPDIVLPRFRVAIFVHGCFWHRHPGCPRASTPSTRQAFWVDKFAKNVTRDRAAELELRAQGWTPVVIWECAVRDEDALRKALADVLPMGRH